MIDLTEGYFAGIRFKSEKPDVIAPPAQIAYSSQPVFRRLDVPEAVLNVKEVNMQIPDQLSHIRVLSDRIDFARSFIPFLYSYRSVTFALMREDSIKKAMNNTKIAEGEIGIDISSLNGLFRKFYEPKAMKLIEIMEFCQRVVITISGIAKSDKYDPTDVLFEKIVEMFDLLFNIDQMKALKTGIINDFAFYKRDKSLIEQMKRDETHSRNVQELQRFFASHNIILDELKRNLFDTATGTPLKSCKFFEKFLVYCVMSYKEDILIPKQRIAILVSIVCVLFIHGNKNSDYSIYNTQIIHDVFEILNENPVIPLYGENSFFPGYLLQKADGFVNDKINPLLMNVDEAKKKEDSYLLKFSMDTFRQLYRSNLAVASKMSREGYVTMEGLNGLLACLSEMTLAVQRQSSFKFMVTGKKPISKAGNAEIEPSRYELAVKYNYSNEDLNSLVELIGYIKTLSSTAILAEPAISKFVNIETNKIVQEFIQNTLERPLVRAKSSGDDNAIKFLEGVRDIFGQWHGINPHADLPKKTKQLKPHEIIDSMVPMSHHQLDVLRIILYSMVNPKSPFLKGQGMFTWSHFRPKHSNLTNEFLGKIRGWYTLLDYTNVMREATNLGFLWFRETYLDMEKVLQYPVRSSLPFILSEHLLNESGKPALHDSLFFPFELYNDAAAQAINVYDSQYLYQEIHAEADLCINMIAFSFSETFYKFCRETASAIELPPECLGLITPTPMRYPIMLQQDKMEVLGSPVDFNMIATNKLNSKMLKELEHYVSMLTDIRLTPYIAHLIRVSRTTHALLLEHFLQMDDFEILWQKARGFVSPTALESRLVTSIINTFDFPHLRLNMNTRRFIPGRPQRLEAPSTEPWWNKYILIHYHEMNYIGGEHLRSLSDILSCGELSHIVHVCLGRLDSAFLKAIDLYTQIAPSVRLHKSKMKDDLVGFFSFNTDAYSSLSHPQIGRFFDQMRILGNIIAFLWLLDNELPPTKNKLTITATAMNSISQIIKDNHELFISDPVIQLDSIQTHRSFPSLWSVLEFIICSPKPIKLGENTIAVIPIESFGDGVIVAAQVIITLSGQDNFYLHESICYRALELDEAERVKQPKGDLSQFLYHATVSNQARRFAELISSPYQQKLRDE